MKIAKRGFVSKGTYQLNDTSYQFLRKKEKKRKKKRKKKKKKKKTKKEKKKKRVSDTRWRQIENQRWNIICNFFPEGQFISNWEMSDLISASRKYY